MHEAIYQQVLPSEGIKNIQHHHNSYHRIHGLLQDWVVKQPPVEYQLCGDDTQAPMMASDRLLFVIWAAIELWKSNADQSPIVSCLDMYRTNVLMYHTMVLLAHLTKGQTLDVWGGIQQMSTLRWRWHSYAEKSPPQPGMKSCTSKDIAGGISAMILDHTDRN